MQWQSAGNNRGQTAQAKFNIIPLSGLGHKTSIGKYISIIRQIGYG
jgi:hypothetical protein